MRHVWLILRHDLRLTLREMKAQRLRSSLLLALGLLFLLIGHGIVLALCIAFGHPPPLVAEGVIWLIFAALMAGVAVQQSIALLFVRGDLDLLLASPLSPRSLLAARLLAIAATAGGGVAFFLLPLINGPLLVFTSTYATAYLTWLLLTLIATALGLGVALGLVRLLGPTRGRKVAQILGALAGASIYLATQLPAIVPASSRPAIVGTLARAADSPVVTVTARAGRGDPAALATLAGVSGVAVAAAMFALARLLVRGAQDAEVRTPRRRRLRPVRPWTRGPFTVAVAKDLRLIARDPMLLAQLLPPALYLVPAALAGWRLLGDAVPATVAVIMGGQFATLFTRIAADGEECWDLIRSSPASEARQRFAKMMAALVVPIASATVLCGITAGIGSPGLAAVAWVISLLVSAGCARAQVATIQPVPRRDVLKSRRQTSLASGVINLLLVAAGAGTVALAAAGHALLTAAAALVTAAGVVACFVFIRFKETRHDRR